MLFPLPPGEGRVRGVDVTGLARLPHALTPTSPGGRGGKSGAGHDATLRIFGLTATGAGAGCMIALAIVSRRMLRDALRSTRSPAFNVLVTVAMALGASLNVPMWFLSMPPAWAACAMS